MSSQLRESVPGEDTARAVRERQRLEARAEAEEGMMTRVPLTKRERTGLKQQRRAGLAGNSFIDDFADDVDAIVQVCMRHRQSCKYPQIVCIACAQPP